jgi:hypothetical protein
LTLPRNTSCLGFGASLTFARFCTYLFIFRSEEAIILPTPEKATFLIADITGYSKFLAATEIAHAQDIVSDFLNTVTNSLGPDFLVAKYEGDAVLNRPGFTGGWFVQ